MSTVHLIVKGKVQGVFYRANAKDKAEELGVAGWVQNTEDGNVEIVATATQPALDAFINWCREGPRRAQVTDVTINKVEEKQFNSFTIKK